MLAKLRPRSAYDVMAALSLLLVLTGSFAYAANTIGSADIIDGEVKTPDLAANAVNSAKISDGQLTEADIGQGAVATNELKNDGVTNAKVLNGTLVGPDVKDNALKGVDIDESTLSSIGGGGPAGGDLTGTYPNPQIRANAVGSTAVTDGSLKDEDLGFSLVDYEVSIGNVPANLCVSSPVSGGGNFIGDDHLLLTPDLQTAAFGLIYSAAYNAGGTQMYMQVCNFQNFAIDDETTKFNLLAIDTQ